MGATVEFDQEENAVILESRICAMFRKTPSELDNEDEDRLYSAYYIESARLSAMREAQNQAEQRAVVAMRAGR